MQAKTRAGASYTGAYDRQADRIVRILASIDAANATELRESAYGWLTITAQAMNLSKATVSRDFALVRRIHRQFGRMFGRSFDPKRDKIFWSWNWAHYGFMTPESTRAGFLKPVGHFPSTLANRRLKSLTVASVNCRGITVNSSHS